MAAQRRWEPPQPAGGSRVVTDAMAYDAMIPYIDTPGPTVPQRAGWAMTEPTFKDLKLLTAVEAATRPCIIAGDPCEPTSAANPPL